MTRLSHKITRFSKKIVYARQTQVIDLLSPEEFLQPCFGGTGKCAKPQIASVADSCTFKHICDRFRLWHFQSVFSIRTTSRKYNDSSAHYP